MDRAGELFEASRAGRDRWRVYTTASGRAEAFAKRAKPGTQRAVASFRDGPRYCCV